MHGCNILIHMFANGFRKLKLCHCYLSFPYPNPQLGIMLHLQVQINSFTFGVAFNMLGTTKGTDINCLQPIGTVWVRRRVDFHSLYQVNPVYLRYLSTTSFFFFFYFYLKTKRGALPITDQHKSLVMCKKSCILIFVNLW